MLYKWEIVEEGRKSLGNASPKLLDEQVRLVWTMYVCAHLQELEHATHLLSHP